MLTVFHESAIQVIHFLEICWLFSMKSQFKSYIFWGYVDCFPWKRNSSQALWGNVLTVFHESAIQVKHSEEIYWLYSIKSQFKSYIFWECIDCKLQNRKSSQTIWGKVWSDVAIRNRNTSCNAWRASRSKNAIGILEQNPRLSYVRLGFRQSCQVDYRENKGIRLWLLFPVCIDLFVFLVCRSTPSFCVTKSTSVDPYFPILTQGFNIIADCILGYFSARWDQIVGYTFHRHRVADNACQIPGISGSNCSG